MGVQGPGIEILKQVPVAALKGQVPEIEVHALQVVGVTCPVLPRCFHLCLYMEDTMFCQAFPMYMESSQVCLSILALGFPLGALLLQSFPGRMFHETLILSSKHPCPTQRRKLSSQ